MRRAAPGIADGTALADMPLPKRTPPCAAERKTGRSGVHRAWPKR